jgi:fused signal recognition particle receptor
MLGWFKKKLTSRKKEEDIQENIPREGDESVEGEVVSGEGDEHRADDSASQDTQPEPEKKQSFFMRLQERLAKTRDSLVSRIDSLFSGRKIDQDLLDELEEILITSDLGVATTQDLLNTIRDQVSRDELADVGALKAALKDAIFSYLEKLDQSAEMVIPDSGPLVIKVVGVNGVGKTTTIGKIANKFVKAGRSVLLVAGDTFRAAAVEQLKVWGERVGVEVFSQQAGADPSSVVYDAMDYAESNGFDVIIIDTAGRLHTKVNLMEELKKIKRVIGKKIAGAPHEIMLVLDATTGQNSLSQTRLFNEAVGVTGLTLSKLDGTAKGGIVINICHQFNIPVRFIGIGEGLEDLRDFDARQYIDALFAEGEFQGTGKQAEQVH